MHLLFYIYLFFGRGEGDDWSFELGLMLAKQLLYHLSHPHSPHLLFKQL